MTDYDPALIEKAAQALAHSYGHSRQTVRAEWFEDWMNEALAVLDAVADDLRAAAWDEGANSAVEPHNVGTRMTLRAVIPFPDNPYEKEADRD